MKEQYFKESSRSNVSVLEPKTAIGFSMALFLSILVFFVVSRLSPPSAVGDTAPMTDFSSGRAMRHLDVIGRRSRPIGSSGQESARRYISSVLSSYGLQPEVQETTVLNSRWSGVRAATVRNIAAKLKGTSDGRALLIVGHYDTVSTSPGASDDGAALASMLETLRALKAGTPLKNDIIFLFTDGEEVGLLGAKAFVEAHPWAKEVGLVLNFEARGVSGPVIMFETGEGNNWLIKEFAKAAPHPIANSLSYEIYKLLPNDTDLTIFKGAGLQGMNFAYIEGFLHYHTQADSIENIDERSLQHQGVYALALARHFGNQNLDLPRRGNAIYFDVLGMTLLHYPAGWVIPLTVIIISLFAAVIVLGIRKTKLTSKGIATGFCLFIVAVATIAGTVTLIWWLIYMLQVRSGRSLMDDYYHGNFYLGGFVFVAVALNSTFYNFFRGRVSVEDLTAGALICWLLLLIPSSIGLPGGSYLLMWPSLFGIVALIFMLVADSKDPNSLTRLAILSSCAVPGIVLLVPIIYQVFVAMGMRQITPIIAIVVLLCGLLIPQFSLMAVWRKWWLPAGAAAVAICLITAAVFNSGFDRRHPATSHVFYVLNADTEKAVWASADLTADEWTSQFFAANAERGPLRDELHHIDSQNYLKSPAPIASFQPASVRVISDSMRGDFRILLMRITSQYEGVIIAVIPDANMDVMAAVINGKRLESRRTDGAQQIHGSWKFQYWAPPKEGFDLALELSSGKPVQLKVIEQSYGLPETLRAGIKPRPDNMIPSPLWNSDLSLISKSHTF
jgi:Peptidase family M28